MTSKGKGRTLQQKFKTKKILDRDPTQCVCIIYFIFYIIHTHK